MGGQDSSKMVCKQLLEPNPPSAVFMQNRNVQHRRERMADALREEIGALIEGELGDPRIGLATVSEVLLAADGKSARVFVEAEGTEKEAEDTLQGLNAARGFIRHQLVERLGLRHAPEIFFQLDTSTERQTRIDQLLRRIHKKK
jgi:ribosome-binding factor A